MIQIDTVLSCMRCQEVFRYMVNGADVPLEFIPAEYDLRWSVCDECCAELSARYAMRNAEVANGKDS